MNVSYRWTLGATLTMAAALGIARFGYTPLLPNMQSSLAWSMSQAGDVASANYLGYMVGALLAAKTVNGNSAPNNMMIWLGISLMGCVASVWLGASTESFLGWMLVRFLAGVASAYCLVITTSLLAEVLTANNQTRLGNLHFSGVGIGMVLSVWVATHAVDVSTQWAWLAAGCALLLAIAWFCFRNFSDDTDQFSVPSAHESARQQVAARASVQASTAAFWRVVVAYGFFGFGYIVTATFIVAMTRAADLGMTTENLVWLVVGLTSIPSVLFWQWLAGNWGLVLVLRCAYLVEAIGVLMAGLVQSPELVAAALLFGGALLGGTIAAITALGLSLGRLLLPANPARAIAIMTAAFALGQLLGPSVAGRIAESTGSFLLPSLLAASLLLIGVVLIPKLERA